MKEDQIKTIGKYSYYLEKCLGVGSFGRVYKGYENSTLQEVAVKKVDFKTLEKDIYLQKAIHEQINILSKFKHPNIVRLHQVLHSKRSLYIIMDFCRNGDLKQYLKGKRGLPQNEAYDIMRQVSLGYRELARQNTIHRDLKPANILRNNGNFLICDFGFSKVLRDPSATLHTCVGSPVYMAPQILQKFDYSAKCDIWSLGIIYYQLLHGDVPWNARSQKQLIAAIKQIPLNLTKGNAAAHNLIRSMLVINEKNRASLRQIEQYFNIIEEPTTDGRLALVPDFFQEQFSQNIQRTSSADKKNNQSLGSTVKVINRSYFEQLGWRYFVCVQIRLRLWEFKSFNLQVNTFERLLVMISSSIVSNMKRRMEEIKRIHQKDVLELVLSDFQHYCEFRSLFLAELSSNFATCDIPKEFEIESICREDYFGSGLATAQRSLRNKIGEVLKKLFDQIKKCQHNQQKQSLVYVVQLILDMIQLNSKMARSGVCAIEDLLHQRSTKIPLRRLNTKIAQEFKNTEFF